MHISGSKIWNELPDSIREIESDKTFSKMLTKHLLEDV